MITEQDLQEAIAECQGQRNPNASTCIKLAAFYTIRDAMFPRQEPAYSFAPAPDQAHDSIVDIDGGSEFASIVAGRRQRDVWPVIVELLETVRTLHPKLYDAVLGRLE